MQYLIYEHRTNSTTIPATRYPVAICQNLNEVRINVNMLRNSKHAKNYDWEVIAIRHDGEFHLEKITL